jgi:hypothetical protein
MQKPWKPVGSNCERSWTNGLSLAAAVHLQAANIQPFGVVLPPPVSRPVRQQIWQVYPMQMIECLTVESEHE